MGLLIVYSGDKWGTPDAKLACRSQFRDKSGVWRGQVRGPLNSAIYSARPP